MLYHILYPLAEQFKYLNIFKYITFRTFTAFIISLVLSLVLGKKFIDYMKKKHFGQVVRDDGPQKHLRKSGTPTMGGIFIIFSIIISLIFCGNVNSAVFNATMTVLLSYFVLGLVDDYLKVLKKDTDGVSPKAKLIWQFLTAGIVSYYLYSTNNLDTKLYLPFIKDSVIDLGLWYVVFSSIVVVGSSNAVNLTDGLDGLAIGNVIISASILGILAYLSGHNELSEYLFIPYVKGSGELLVIVGSLIGAGFGFLWYNSHPAEVFMGDVGSLSLGGALGMIAVSTKNEFLFVITGGIFVIEALSVIIQVASFKLRGKRVFKMAPIHHHFELKGWDENKVIIRFWIMGIILGMISLATLKIR
jgi:phospho-N-acetylmuramoyl-pentapeptide-transferase